LILHVKLNQTKLHIIYIFSSDDFLLLSKVEPISNTNTLIHEMIEFLKNIIYNLIYINYYLFSYLTFSSNRITNTPMGRLQFFFQKLILTIFILKRRDLI